jgi:NADH-quinone oxidoreductase subunit H
MTATRAPAPRTSPLAFTPVGLLLLIGVGVAAVTGSWPPAPSASGKGPAGLVLVTSGQIGAFLVSPAVAGVLLWADRKIWAGVQLRKGPNVVGPFGLLQSFADFLKFALKEVVVPAGADKSIFLLAPLIAFVLGFIAWAVIPVAPGWVVADLNVGILYLFAVSSLGVYGIIMGGWASNSKYPFLGSLRSAAQMVSYEVSIGFVIVTVILLAGTMNLTGIVNAQGGWFWNWNVFGGGGLTSLPMMLVMVPMMVIFFVSSSRRRTGRRSTCPRPSPSSWPATWSSTAPRPSCSSRSASTRTSCSCAA